MQIITASDSRLQWPGAVSLQTAADGVSPWRIPFGDRTLFNPTLQERAAMPAGVRLTFRTNSPVVAGRITPVADASDIDLVCDGGWLGSQPLAGRDRFEFANLPAGEHVVELWLPQYGTFRLQALELAAGATCGPAPDNRPRWITYGSSITQCRTAASPTRTWPAIVARTRGLNLTCLGYGGQCHLDSQVARLMRDLPADYLSLCVGINIYGGATLSARTFGASLIGFVKILREKHPTTPVLVCSPIYACERETTKNAVGFTLPEMRSEVAQAVEILRAAGDPALRYQDGLELFGPDLVGRLPDRLHPDAEGYQRLAENFLTVAAPKLFKGLNP
ncbi:MAG: hypothetical protein PCFJNLEI_01506 [Verrucomicrobiae bacterium]|nr:hypothetical protein [Verrucomicrobiae bacterium]